LEEIATRTATGEIVQPAPVAPLGACYARAVEDYSGDLLLLYADPCPNDVPGPTTVLASGSVGSSSFTPELALTGFHPFVLAAISDSGAAAVAYTDLADNSNYGTVKVRLRQSTDNTLAPLPPQVTIQSSTLTSSDPQARVTCSQRCHLDLRALLHIGTQQYTGHVTTRTLRAHHPTTIKLRLAGLPIAAAKLAARRGQNAWTTLQGLARDTSPRPTNFARSVTLR
jgi:hypothetical protein